MFYVDIANQLSAGNKFWVIFSNDISKWEVSRQWR